MNELLTVARQALPILKPLAIKLGISVTTGILCELGGKYARRAVAAQILSQRDKDIQAALEYHRVFTENERAMNEGGKKMEQSLRNLSDMAE